MEDEGQPSQPDPGQAPEPSFLIVQELPQMTPHFHVDGQKRVLSIYPVLHLVKPEDMIVARGRMVVTPSGKKVEQQIPVCRVLVPEMAVEIRFEEIERRMNMTLEALLQELGHTVDVPRSLAPPDQPGAGDTPGI